MWLLGGVVRLSFVVGVVLIDQWWGLLISYNIMYKTNAVFLEIYPGNKRDAPTLEALIKNPHSHGLLASVQQTGKT